MLKEIQFAIAPGSVGTKLVKFFTYINKSIAFCQSNSHAKRKHSSVAPGVPRFPEQSHPERAQGQRRLIFSRFLMDYHPMKLISCLLRIIDRFLCL